ncbi:hypothetical protein T03_1179 [Trichinella britovi]|uniref:Uncharacterized protein n=1 Tax=Trichinella britovi TaxID=45882 RepID=A0A0V0YTJ6_TRIBR|nr:hypothetical protein T03_1179 [Trichinella britovi]
MKFCLFCVDVRLEFTIENRHKGVLSSVRVHSFV